MPRDERYDDPELLPPNVRETLRMSERMNRRDAQRLQIPGVPPPEPIPNPKAPVFRSIPGMPPAPEGSGLEKARKREQRQGIFRRQFYA